MLARKKTKTFIAVLPTLALFAALTAGGTVCMAGETRFVQPSVEVPLRRGQGTEYKIIKLIKDGDRVELLETGESWARIRVESGAEGWIPKRFLSKQAPPVKQVQILKTENDRLKQENSRLQNQLQELSGVQSTTGNELSACIAERDTLKTRYQTLTAETADVMAIKKQAEQTRQEMERIQAAMQEVQQQNNDLRRKTALSWFLAGGGVLMVGWIIGLITCRSRKRRPSLL